VPRHRRRGEIRIGAMPAREIGPVAAPQPAAGAVPAARRTRDRPRGMSQQAPDRPTRITHRPLRRTPGGSGIDWLGPGSGCSSYPFGGEYTRPGRRPDAQAARGCRRRSSGPGDPVRHGPCTSGEQRPLASRGACDVAGRLTGEAVTHHSKTVSDRSSLRWRPGESLGRGDGIDDESLSADAFGQAVGGAWAGDRHRHRGGQRA
jgi:hypothetical protein